MMKLASSQTGGAKGVRHGTAGRRVAGQVRRTTGHRAETKGEGRMQSQARAGRMRAVAPHPLAELLECPSTTQTLLSDSTMSIDLDAGGVVFRQSEASRGLYIVLSGRFVRKTERMETPLTLGPVRAGELVELAAVLGDGGHTYTLTAQTQGSVLLLPKAALSRAFEQYPRLRMQLLEELAREVSRAYHMCRLTRALEVRRRGARAVRA